MYNDTHACVLNTIEVCLFVCACVLLCIQEDLRLARKTIEHVISKSPCDDKKPTATATVAS